MRINLFRRFVFMMLSLIVLLAQVPVFAEGDTDAPAEALTAFVIENKDSMFKYGHIYIDCAADDVLALFDYGDLVTVDLGKYGSYDVPVCPSYDDVAISEKLLRVVSGENEIDLAINYGQIGVECGILEKAAEGSDQNLMLKEGVSFPIPVTITLKAAGAGDNLMGNLFANLIRTNERTDYPGLTDAEYANFRAVTTTGMGEGRLYRSSSPISPHLARNAYADAAAAAAGVKTFINLSDTKEEALSFPGYGDSYYRSQEHIFLSLSLSLLDEGFTEGLAEGFRFMLDHAPPYLVHCIEGKDRTGLFCAVLECLMGAGCDEVSEDYAITYCNFFSVENGVQRELTEEELSAVRGIIISNLELCFGIEITEESDLVAAAEDYLESIGLTADEIAALKDVLR